MELPKICDNMRFFVCSNDHVHIVMECDGVPIAECIYEAEDADKIAHLMEKAVDEALA